MNYTPQPLETHGLDLPPELLNLTERLARNAHEVWAAQRLKDGWTLGPQRDDSARQHPCLVPYDQLPESEKRYDRQAALGTLKAVLALGYHVAPAAAHSLSGTAPPPDGVALAGALARWRTHLEAEAPQTAPPGYPRCQDFDLDDEPELPLLDAFPRMQAACRFLHERLLPAWREADRKAIRHQTRHRWIARGAILGGTGAIVLAIVQMAFKTTAPSVHLATLGLEITAVLAAGGAVLLGWWSRSDHSWLTERYRAERLRVLKFRALAWPSLWSQDLSKWKAELNAELEALQQPVSLQAIKAWSTEDQAELDSVAPLAPPSGELEALRTYYLAKRLGCQITYFKARAVGHQRAARPWRSLSWPVFLTAMGCVIVHFVADTRLGDHHPEIAASLWEGISRWSLALGAIIPVVGLGARVWLGAFEMHRSANLFAAKQHALERGRQRILAEAPGDPALLAHLANVEQFLENEHREWLRLLLETEWMV